MRTLSRTLFAASILTSFLAVFASPAGTRNDGSRPVKLSETTEVLGTTVPPGSYEVRWTREPGSETVKLEVTHGKKVLASGKGVWVSADRPHPYEALVYRHPTLSASELTEIRFRNSVDSIRVDSAAAEAVAPHGDAPPSSGSR